MKQFVILVITSLLIMCRAVSESGQPVDPVGPLPRFLITKAGVYDGATMGVSPGDTVAIMAGEYTYFRFRNFVGSATRPIVFLNYRGLVRVSSPIAGLSNITLTASRYIVLSGQGDAGTEYGFRIAAPALNVTALSISGKSSDVDVNHIEVDTAGFAGIMAKTDPIASDSSTWRGRFTMYNLVIHHNYIHNTRGEGLYVGSSFWNEGVTKTIFPHEIVGLSIHHNRTERTGCEGIQYACAANSQVFNNQVSQTGRSPFASFQDNGVQIGGGVSGLFVNNEISDVPSVGLIIVGHRGPLTIHNNSISNAGLCGVFIDERTGSVAGAEILFSNCTINTGAQDAFRLYNRNQRNVVSHCAIFSSSPYELLHGQLPTVEEASFIGSPPAPEGIGYQHPN